METEIIFRIHFTMTKLHATALPNVITN